MESVQSTPEGSGIDMIHFIDPNFVEKDEVLYKGPPGGEDLQPADGGVRPGVKTGFDDGVERTKRCCLKLMLL